MRYAYFPAQRRLAIAVHGDLRLYDTLDHQVSGVSQQQGPGRTVTFTSEQGVMDVATLPLMASSRVERPAAAPPPAPAVAPAPAIDICATLERLAALRHQGILSEAEFTAKKAELLRRL